MKTERRVGREGRTIRALVELYCRKQHGGRRSLCPDCGQLLDYARQRLEHCPLGENKPTCDRCRIHCYRPVERERIRAVMRFSGPRLLRRHPYLALRHLLDRRRSRNPSAASRTAA